jgi:hypothetical protein
MGDAEWRFERSAQFHVCAARAMRHLLIHRARDCKRMKAGGKWMRVTLGDSVGGALAIESSEPAFAIDLSPRIQEPTLKSDHLGTTNSAHPTYPPVSVAWIQPRA